MKQIIVKSPGGPEMLELAEAPLPPYASDEILIRIVAAGVNRPDLLQRQGQYPPPPSASPILGLEAAGTVAAAGADVTEWQAGDRVCALLSGGGYAEYCAVPAVQCLPVPDGMSLHAAAALPETYFTVWTNLFERGRLASGESVLIHGGSSGIGTTAIQLAKAFGATVFVTAGSTEKCDACRRLGADEAFNYHTQDFVEAVQSMTDGVGVDVILDMVGGDYVAWNVQALAAEGRLVQIAFLQGAQVELDLRPIMMKRLTVTGSTLRSRSAAEKGRIARALREHVWPLLASGQAHPVIDRVFPLAEAGAAHAYMETGGHIGKIILAVRSE